MNRPIRWILLLAAAMIGQASAQQVVDPAKGHKPGHQKIDEAACHTWAVQQTGFDPAKPPPAAPAAAQQQRAGFAKARAACLEGRDYTVK